MIDEKYLELFLDEVTEHIDDLNRSLLELEQDKENPEIINEIFRVAHTLKSSAGFVGLEYLSRLAHRMEDLFQLIKDKKIQINTELMNLLFSCLDAIKNAVANVQDNKDEDKDALNELVHQIDQFVEYELKSRPQDIEPKKEEVKKEIPSIEEIPKQKVPKIELEISEEEKKQLLELIAPQDHVYVGHVLIDSDASMKNLRLLLIYNRLARIASVFKLDPTIDQLEKNSNIDKLSFVIYGNISKDQIVRLCQIDLVEEISVKEVELKKSAIVDVTSKIHEKAPTQQTATVQKKQEKDVQDLSENIIKSRNIKVDSRKIDYIINNVGELVITNSGLQKIYEDLLEEYGESQIISDLRSKIDQAIRIARELQSGVMKMRMMPIGIVFQRFFRPVRDLSLSLGKKVELKIFGEDTELDKNIIDSLNDPLMHLIRNAIDHGIEPPEERLKKGKPEVGTVILRSYQSGNHIFIEVQDDGRGLNKEKIYNKALSLGLVKDKENLTDQEIYEFIFYPGFSTATQVSNVSGRGVGMNVVKEVINEFKGAVKIQTEPEKGTTFILMFPLTLAIISTIHVKIENEEYAFPLSDVVETIRILPSQITKLQGKNIINIRKEIVPIYELSVLMGLPSKLNDILVLKEESNNDNIKNEFPVVITSVANKKIGFIVEEMIGKKEIVIKSLDQNYKNIPGLIGACLLGDGSIVMVLDVNGLIEIATKNYEEQLSLTKTNEEVRKAIQNYNKKVVELTRITKHTKKKVIVNKKIPETPSEKTIVVENKKRNSNPTTSNTTSKRKHSN
jgi:two-component system chemotaxis sensor kinase CheA